MLQYDGKMRVRELDFTDLQAFVQSLCPVVFIHEHEQARCQYPCRHSPRQYMPVVMGFHLQLCRLFAGHECVLQDVTAQQLTSCIDSEARCNMWPPCNNVLADRRAQPGVCWRRRVFGGGRHVAPAGLAPQPCRLPMRRHSRRHGRQGCSVVDLPRVPVYVHVRDASIEAGTWYGDGQLKDVAGRARVVCCVQHCLWIHRRTHAGHQHIGHGSHVCVHAALLTCIRAGTKAACRRLPCMCRP